MVLLNDVQKIVLVPQIQYIAVCDATTSSPKLQECSETADMCSKSMEWSMFLSWCMVQRLLSTIQNKNKLSASLHFVVPVVFSFQKITFVFENIVEHFFLVFVDKGFLLVLSVVEVSAEDLQLFVEIFINKNKFLQKNFFDVVFV